MRDNTVAMSPKYSFVMPAFKAAFIKEAIDSILGQTCPDFELIVVDDASPEGLGSIVSKYDDPRISYYRNVENIGGKDLVAQWNHSIQYAKGEIVILASDDDVYDKDYLLCIDELVGKYPSVNVFKTLIRHIDSDGNEISCEQKCLDELCDFRTFLMSFCLGDIMSGIPQYAFRKSALLSIGGFVNFPTAWFSDDATVAKLAVNGIALYNEVLFSFRDSDINISGMNNSFDMIEKKIDASVQYDRFIKKVLVNDYGFSSDGIEYTEVLNRTRRSIIHSLKHSKSSVFFHGLRYIHKLDVTTFPLLWQIRRYIGYYYNRILRR